MANIKSGWIAPWLVFRCLDEYYLRDIMEPIQSDHPVGTASVRVVVDRSNVIVYIHPAERKLEQRLAFIDQIARYSPKAAAYLESLSTEG